MATIPKLEDKKIVKTLSPKTLFLKRLMPKLANKLVKIATIVGEKPNIRAIVMPKSETCDQSVCQS